MENPWVEGLYYDWEPETGYEKSCMLKRIEKLSERSDLVKLKLNEKEEKSEIKQKKAYKIRE